jgi:hypothetical protein
MNKLTTMLVNIILLCIRFTYKYMFWCMAHPKACVAMHYVQTGLFIWFLFWLSPVLGVLYVSFTAYAVYRTERQINRCNTNPSSSTFILLN